MYYFCPLHQNL